MAGITRIVSDCSWMNNTILYGCSSAYMLLTCIRNLCAPVLPTLSFYFIKVIQAISFFGNLNKNGKLFRAYLAVVSSLVNNHWPTEWPHRSKGKRISIVSDVNWLSGILGIRPSSRDFLDKPDTCYFLYPCRVISISSIWASPPCLIEILPKFPWKASNLCQFRLYKVSQLWILSLLSRF